MLSGLAGSLSSGVNCTETSSIEQILLFTDYYLKILSFIRTATKEACMRLTQLRSFHAVARAGGFTGAARLLHISQPTVTTQVRFLEDIYGVELFYRRGHSVILTPLGEQLYALTQKVFSIEEEMIHLLEDSGELKTGRLRVGAVGPFHVTEMLAEFNQFFPNIMVTVQVGNSESVLSRLMNYETDVAVLAHFNDNPALLSIPYSSHPIVVFVPINHRFAKKKSIKISDLQDEGMVLREEGSTTRKAFEDTCRRKDITPRVVMEIGSREAIREAVIKGVGIGIVSEVEYVPDPQICKVNISDADIFTHAHIVCLTDRKEARLIRAFIDIATTLQKKRK
jgi:aminoethylphosphonate catabolism LysR family transcriptional regulator